MNKTVVPNEIALYDCLSSVWWDTDKPKNVLYYMNQIRIPWIVDSLSKHGLIAEKNINLPKLLQGVSVLDVGCGAGYLTEELGKLGASVTGIDPSMDTIKVAQDHLAKFPEISTVSYLCESIEKHSESNREKYDAITILEVVHHVDELDLFLKFCLDCLKPGGLIFIACYHKTWTSWFINVLHHFVEGVPFEFIRWNSFKTPEEIAECFEKHNCKCENVKGMRYNFLKSVWHWCHYFPSHFALYGVKRKTEKNL